MSVHDAHCIVPSASGLNPLFCFYSTLTSSHAVCAVTYRTVFFVLDPLVYYDLTVSRTECFIIPCFLPLLLAPSPGSQGDWPQRELTPAEMWAIAVPSILTDTPMDALWDPVPSAPGISSNGTSAVWAKQGQCGEPVATVWPDHMKCYPAGFWETEKAGCVFICSSFFVLGILGLGGMVKSWHCLYDFSATSQLCPDVPDGFYGMF